MKYINTLILSILFSSAVLAQSTDSLYLNIVIPEQDTVMYSYSRYRVAANTLPQASAFINGKETKVYATGAFVDMIYPENDTTHIEFKVVLDGKEITRNMVLIKPEREPVVFNGKEIKDRMVKPGNDVWLNTGEKLVVQTMATPGEHMVFNIDGFKRNIPMRELSGEESGGRKGIYQGSYVVKPGDYVMKQHVTFKMKKGLFGYIKKTSDFEVTLGGGVRVGKVIEDGAYLNSGLGTDRLGGYKYGFIEKDILLNITGMKNGSYRVKLADGLDAWIPEKFVELMPAGIEPVESLTGNIRISGNSSQDIITLNLSEKLPYTTFQQLDPNKIIVDVYGATSNTNWKTKMLSSEGIKKVEWEQVANGQFRMIIELDHSQNWGYSVGYGWGSQLAVKINRPPVITDPVKPLSGRTIAVDAGHGGSSNGALGASGAKEKEVTLQITQKLDSLLKLEGVNVILPRTDDSYVYMSERREAVLSNKADLLVSIHANSIGYTSDPREVAGTGGFYKHMAYRPLAEILYKNMLDLGLKDYGLTGSFNFSLSGPIEFPNALVETAFISNPEEEILLLDPDFQVKIAEQIVKGLKEFYLKHASIEALEEMPEK